MKDEKPQMLDFSTDPGSLNRHIKKQQHRERPAALPRVKRQGRQPSLTDPSKTFVCHLCNSRFGQAKHLKRHNQSVHIRDKPFECNQCGKKFSQRDNLSQHSQHACAAASYHSLG